MVHYIGAFVLIGMLVMQMTTGVIVRSMVLADRYNRCMKVMKVFHGISGYVVILAGRAMISLGLLQYGNDQL